MVVTDTAGAVLFSVVYFYHNLEAFVCAAFESKTNFPMGTIKYIFSYLNVTYRNVSYHIVSYCLVSCRIILLTVRDVSLGDLTKY